MRKILHLVCALGFILIGQDCSAATRASANYSITAESMDGGGINAASSKYGNHGSLGGISGLANMAYPVEMIKSGYVGQLYQVTGLTLSPKFADNGATQQLAAMQTLDDGTMMALMGGTESWSVVAGQIPAGLTLNMSTGVISGMPTSLGTYSFTVLVTDGLGDSAQQTFSGAASVVTSADTPTMPTWGLFLLAILLFSAAGRCLKNPEKAESSASMQLN